MLNVWIREQRSFRSEGGSVNEILTLESLANKSKENNQRVLVSFMVLENAYE